jgi:phospholipase C
LGGASSGRPYSFVSVNGALGVIAGIFEAFGDGTFETLVSVGQFFHDLVLGFGIMQDISTFPSGRVMNYTSGRCGVQQRVSRPHSLAVPMKRLTQPRGTASSYARLTIAISAVCFFAFQCVSLQCVAQSSQIKHIVIIVQESRSFDTMFGKLPGVDGATTGDYLGNTVALKQAPLSSEPLPDSWSVTKNIIADGMDDFYYGNGNPEKSAYVQFSQSQIPNYWQYAQSFAIADNFFASTYGGSFPNHLYLVAAQSGSAIGNPDSTVAWGCDSPAGTTVLLANGQKVFPCFTVPTLQGELNAAAVTWQFYSASEGQAGYIYSVLDAFRGIRNSGQWKTNVLPVTQFVSNAMSGTLANVVWVTPPAADSDSPPANVCAGEDWAVQMINAVMQSTGVVIDSDFPDMGGLRRIL